MKWRITKETTELLHKTELLDDINEIEALKEPSEAQKQELKELYRELAILVPKEPKEVIEPIDPRKGIIKEKLMYDLIKKKITENEYENLLIKLKD